MSSQDLEAARNSIKTMADIDVMEFIAKKPNYEVGASSQLKLSFVKKTSGSILKLDKHISKIGIHRESKGKWHCFMCLNLKTTLSEILIIVLVSQNVQKVSVNYHSCCVKF